MYLKKYDLKANDAILADEKHMPMWVCGGATRSGETFLIDRYDDIVAHAKVSYVAGGAGQNAARAAAVSPSFKRLNSR